MTRAVTGRSLSIARAALIAAVLALNGCGAAPQPANSQANAAAATTVVTITSANGPHRFTVELARSADAQERGLMFRTELAPDAGMLFAPYPPEGGPPRVATFWMKNTPIPLDIVFIRADGSIARIATNTVPFSEDRVSSDEPVAAVLELAGGRADALGIAEGDKASWTMPR